MMKRTLPKDAIAYAKSPTFRALGVDDEILKALKIDISTTREIPGKLLKEHDTKAGAWGLLRVLHGEVQFFLSTQSEVFSVVKAGGSCVIIPQEKHHIVPSDDAVFFIEFLREQL